MMLAAATTLLGCQVSRVVIKPSGYIHGPAPAYGYYKRYPHRHRYDDQLGLYIFLESPDIYYYDNDNYYYRWSIQFKRWERAHEPRGDWRKIHKSKVPPKLVKRRLKRNNRLNRRTAPAKHAPAYGYYKRYPHRHRYDDALGLYIFLESPYTYYQDDHYIRWSVKLNRWERAREPYGNWRQLDERMVPPKLLKQRSKSKNRYKIRKEEPRTKREIRKRELEKAERNANKRVNGRDKKELKKDRRTKRRDYLEECEENGNGRGRLSNRCRD